MTQYSRENPIVAPQSGPDFAADVNEMLQVILTGNEGATRPAGMAAGGLWSRDNGSGDVEVLLYNGVTDVVVYPRSGSRVLLDTVDFSASPTLVGSGSTAYYEFPLFDPTLYIGYEWEFVSLEADISGILLEILTTTDAGASYTNSSANVRTIVDDGSGGPSASTTPYLHSGDNTTQPEFFTGSLKIMRPDITGITHGEYNIRRSNNASTILVQSGYYLHGLAIPMNGIALRRVNQITAGFMYMYGISA